MQIGLFKILGMGRGKDEIFQHIYNMNSSQGWSLSTLENMDFSHQNQRCSLQCLVCTGWSLSIPVTCGKNRSECLLNPFELGRTSEHIDQCVQTTWCRTWCGNSAQNTMGMKDWAVGGRGSLVYSCRFLSPWQKSCPMVCFSCARAVVNTVKKWDWSQVGGKCVFLGNWGGCASREKG